MKILLHEYHDLEEKTSKSLKVWKAWHLALYALIAIFGILNFTFLQNAKELVDGNCVFYPVVLEFHTVLLEGPIDDTRIKFNVHDKINDTNTQAVSAAAALADKSKEVTVVDKREIKLVDTYDDNGDFGNATHHAMLQTDRTLFGDGTNCEFAEYMPVLSTIFAVVWITMFIMCPAGGRSRSGLQQPWRILTPALTFALLMVVFTGVSFAITDGGLRAFCASFRNYTNTTTCSAVNPFLERAAGKAWGFGGRAACARAASAGVWAGWAVAAALLLARCLVAPDFMLRRTGVHITSDPQQKITSSLKNNSARSSQRSPRRRDNVSVTSEPTLTSQLVSASVEGQQSAPASLITTPVRDSSNVEMLELASSTPR